MMQTAVVVLMLSGFLFEAQANPTLDTEGQGLEAAGDPVGQNIPRVAFFAAFYTDTEEGNHGPFTVATPLKYKKVVTNFGNGYNPSTGVFTATVKGMYVFHFTMFCTFNPAPNAVAALKKNDQYLAYAMDRAGSDTHDSSTRVAVVALEVGDNVYVELEANRQIYDYHGDHNSFSGFLLFPM